MVSSAVTFNYFITNEAITQIISNNSNYCIKSVSHAINIRVLTGKNVCINHAFHMLLMHGFCTLHICILGCHKIDVINSNAHRNERN